MRAPVFPLAAAFVVGLLLSRSLSMPRGAVAGLLGAAVVLLGVALGSIRGVREARGSLVVLFAYLLLGAAAGPARGSLESSLLRSYRDLGAPSFTSPARVVGVVREAPERRWDQTVLTVDGESLGVAREERPAEGGIRLRVRGGFRDRLDDLVASDRIAFWGTLSRPAFFGNPDGFDGEDYLARERLDLFASVKSARLVEVAKKGGTLRSAISRLRRRAADRIDRALGPRADPATRGVLIALVTGDRAGLPTDLEALYREAGVFHVMAISGAHVAIVLFVLYVVARRLGCDEAPVLWLLLVFLPVYAAFCGARPPVVRAVLVAGTVLVARLLSLDRAGGNALSLAALALLVWNPAWIADPGFQLSFAAMAGIVCGASTLAERLRFLGRLRNPLAISLSAQAAVVPVTAWHFHAFTPVAPLASLIAIPLAGVVVVFGLALVGLADVPLVAGALARAAQAGVEALTFSAKTFASFPGASLAVARPSLVWMLTYVLGLLLFRFARGAPRVAAVASLTTLLLALTFGRGHPPARGRLQLTALDVGHGDALVVVLPEGQRILVDGGGFPGSDFDVGDRVVLPYLLDHGGRNVDVVVTTHSDFDHLGGLTRIVETLNLHEIWGGPPRWDRAVYRDFRAAAAARQIPFRQLRSGTTFDWGGARIEVLASGGTTSSDTPESENDRSVVLRLLYGHSGLLLTGDAGEGLEEDLLRTGRPLAATVLKVGHHGSRGSSTPAFLRAVSPKLAVVSARRAPNRPLPADEVLDRLRALGIETLRTDENGAITVRLDAAGTLEVETFRERRLGDGGAARPPEGPQEPEGSLRPRDFASSHRRSSSSIVASETPRPSASSTDSR